MYRQVIDRFALQSLVKQPNIPDFHLMVGSAEELGTLPILVYKNTDIPKEVVNGLNVYKNMTSDEVAQAIADNNLEVNDINGTIALLGSGLGV